MNPLTLVKRIQNINKKEASLGISEEASWHAKYKDSAYVYVGGLPFDLTEGDLLAVFAQYGEIVDVNLVRDKGTGKSKGFAFIAYEDQRSTNLAVDNLNGAQILGRIIRVDHVTKYKKFEEEDEETKQQKREERGVCRAFQSGTCDRGDSCKFSHDEQRAANTGWGAPEDRQSRLMENKFERSATDRNTSSSTRISGLSHRHAHKNNGEEPHHSRAKDKDNERDMSYTRDAPSERDHERRSGKKQLDDRDDSSITVKSLRLRYKEPKPIEERDRRNETTSDKYESKSYDREERYDRERDSRSGHHRDVSHRHHRKDED